MATAIHLASVVVSFCVAICVAADAPPNFVFILTDDQGWSDNSYNCDNSTGMTGRTNERSCISFALRCDQEDPAPTCAMGPGLPHSEFTIAKAVKKSTAGNYASIMIGKWHLGDLWNKTGVKGFEWEANPTTAGFDDWLMTEAEASSSMSNCGCFPVDHANPGPKPPSGYAGISPHGDHCVVGGGYESDWCYPCTNYYYPNASSPIGVTAEATKVPGDDSMFIVDHFEKFLLTQVAAKRPFLAHLALHSIHEPHPAMPEYYHLYDHDPDYLGTLTQMDVQIGRVVELLKTNGVYDNTIIFYTTDNGPHQGAERTDIRFSTSYLRQCKAAITEGGIRVPGMMHAPMLIQRNMNITTPATTADFLPTLMDVLQVESDHPTWTMDGISLLPLLKTNGSVPRSKPLVFDWGGLVGIIDNEWKLINKITAGQCDFQEPYASMKNLTGPFLFNLATDYHELHSLNTAEPEQFARLTALYNDFLASVENSQMNETGCGAPRPPAPPGPAPPPSDACTVSGTWHADSGLNGTDIAAYAAKTRAECCGMCKGVAGCKASDLNGGQCHLKSEVTLKHRKGSTACVPN